ncbi:acyltransferase [Novosphingobium sp. 2638]|uniref:Acyltransferase n=2 Tax=Novosphingobium beihaiensis TaxID=2930389 RepID=A0ABT0BVP4_9SPHN|nr:acyltransferase [Novosphingobium beihaiensis]
MAEHFFFSSWISPSHSSHSIEPIWTFPAFGWIGVQIFFVLSGFVISYTASGATAFKFLSSRIVRLVPAAWICSTITLLVIFYSGDPPVGVALKRWVAALTFFPKPPYIDKVYWTLGLEIFFYFEIFILLAVNKFKYVEWLSVFIAAISCTFWLLFYTVKPEFIDEIYRSREFSIMLVQHGCFFSLGITFWLCIHKITPARIVLIGMCISAGIGQIISEHHGQPDVAGINQTPALAIFVWLLSMCLMLASIYWRDAIKPANWIRTIGLMTYPLYLVHDLLGVEIIKRIIGIGPILSVCVAMALCIALSWLITATLEKRLQKFFRILLDEQRARSRISVPFLFTKSTPPFS